MIHAGARLPRSPHERLREFDLPVALVDAAASTWATSAAATTCSLGADPRARRCSLQGSNLRPTLQDFTSHNDANTWLRMA
jgi:hypothetical protein